MDVTIGVKGGVDLFLEPDEMYSSKLEVGIWRDVICSKLI